MLGVETFVQQLFYGGAQRVLATVEDVLALTAPLDDWPAPAAAETGVAHAAR